MTYQEYTHVTAATAGRSEDINRSIAVRNADDFAVMRDLPNGEERTGQAFPIIAYFDPFAAYGFGWFANLKRVDITLQRGDPVTIAIPQPDPSVNAVVFYFSRFDVQSAPDSTESAVHLLISPTRLTRTGSYISDVVEDAQSGLPSQITLRDVNDDEIITLAYKVLNGHWVTVHANFSQTMHYAILTYKRHCVSDRSARPTDGWNASTVAISDMMSRRNIASPPIRLAPRASTPLHDRWPLFVGRIA